MTKASLLILFGSETGTAQDAAETVWREARQRRVPARVMAFDDYDIQMLPQEIFVIFIVATSGQGELPTNMRQNWRRLLSKIFNFLRNIGLWRWRLRCCAYI
ncbi:flavodoxin domain-containing protein [Ditylenchus destructor]|nr:flavodoxin domain-containing protein [Ditylenchus destructor]